VRIAFDKFERMKRAFLIRLGQQEEAVTQRLHEEDLARRGGAGTVRLDEDGTMTLGEAGVLPVRPRNEDLGLSVRALVNWYLEEQGAELADTAALKAEAKVARKVLARLIRVDRVLAYALDYDGMDEGERPPEDLRVVIINPDS